MQWNVLRKAEPAPSYGLACSRRVGELGYVRMAQERPNRLAEWLMLVRRQAPIVRDKTSIVRACVAGAIRPDEAVTLFKRARQGERT